MTDQELFEKLKREGERWRTGGIVRSRCFGKDPDTGNSNSCISIHDPTDQNPDFSTPDGFFWLWERVQEKDWWNEFLYSLQHWDLIDWGDALAFEFIHPARFTEALKKYLEETK